MKRKIASLALAFIMIVSLAAPFSAVSSTAHAAGFGSMQSVSLLYDFESVIAWEQVADTNDLFIDPNLSADRWWHMVRNSSQGFVYGAVDELAMLHRYAAAFNNYFLNPLYALADLMEMTVAYDSNLGVYRLYEIHRQLWYVTDSGIFPYYVPEEIVENERIDGDHWAHISEVDKSKINVLSEAALGTMLVAVRKSVGPEDNSFRSLDDTYKGIYYWNPSDSLGSKGGDYFWVDQDNHPYCAQIDPNNFGVNLPQDYYTEDDDGDGKYDIGDWVGDDDGSSDDGNDDDYEVGDTVGDLLVDIIQGTIFDITTGDINFIDKIVYDQSNKTYNIDAHTEYNVDLENNNYYFYEFNYEYTYHINYTSVTYIGQSAEYNETYEFYYQLPDGRSSADLTVEELQALNTQIDVLPYIRSADDTSIRALYHFDGDTLDSSYWSYAGNLEWISGASITYMDAGAFNGALFLDETAHAFDVQLPSNLGSSDFTIQFRYYQSATLAPVTDSSISIGSSQIMQLTGDAFILADGTTVPTSIGQWTELCFMRSGNTLYYFYNGVCIGSVAFGGTVSDVISFVFGTEQQTYKYFDELRVTSKALYDPAAGYTPTSVPYDTNLALVLPDSKLPIADAYWDIKSSGTNILSQYGLDNWVNMGENDRLHVNASGAASVNINSSSKDFVSWPYAAPCFWYNSTYSSFFSTSSGSYLSNLGSASGWSSGYCPTYGLVFPLGFEKVYSGLIGSAASLSYNTTYTISMVFSDGDIHSFTFTPNFSSGSSVSFRGYDIATVRYMPSTGQYGWSAVYYLVIRPSEIDSTGDEFVYMELVEGDSTDLTAEYVESVVVMDKDDLNTPSLAVRTDINITGYQIGGVRPSLPTKGLVWALVEDGMITSLQIYNGQAWEAVDGRIWTGSRWVPYYAYDVILLKDLYDIVESDPSLDYIYTESGFWKWLQGAWSQMMGQLSDIENAISGSGSGSGTINPNIPDADKTGFFESLGDIFLSIFSSIGDLLTGIFGFFSDTVFGGIKDFFSVFTDGSLFEGFQQTDEEGNTTTALPDGVSAVFAFFAGIFLVLPEEIRLILFFAIGLLIFMGVLKVVIS